MKSVYNPNVLITGASNGIGRETAVLFASKGYKVWALSRRCKDGVQEFEGGGVIRNIAADVTDIESLKKALSVIDELGIVIHCAGIGVSGSAECTPVEAARAQIETNYFGVLNVNSVVLPLLRKNPRSLVLITTSFAGLVPIPYQSHYSSSKYALEAYGEALRMEAKPFGVKVCLVEPGDTKTGFTAARTHNEPEDSPYYDRCTKSVAKMEHDEMNGKSPLSVAKVFYAQAKRKNPKVRVAVGLVYKVLAFLVRILPSGLRQKILYMLYC